MTNPKKNPNLNNSIDPNDPYSSIQADQPILRDPESDIIAKAMQYYNTEANELSTQVPSATPLIVNTPAPLQPEIPIGNLYNHDYHDGVNQRAEEQLNNLYQQSSLGKIEAPILAPSSSVQDPTSVYESVTYPEANFQNYKSVYNPNSESNIAGATQITPINEDYSATYLNSSIVTDPLQTSQIPREQTETVSEPKSRRLLWIILGIVLISLFIGLGGYTWWIASQQNKDTVKTASSSTSIQSNSDVAASGESSRSTRSVAVVFNDPTGPKPSDIAKKDNSENITPEFLKQNFEPETVKDDKCQDKSLCGKDVDKDKDGLTLIQEQAYRTNPNKADSDDDKIADGDEVNIYNTDPTKSDSTNSGYSDFDKVKACNDPAFKFTNIPNKFSSERQKQLMDNISKFKLQELTINSLKAIGANNTDLTTGTIAESCSPVNIKL